MPIVGAGPVNALRFTGIDFLAVKAFAAHPSAVDLSHGEDVPPGALEVWTAKMFLYAQFANPLAGIPVNRSGPIICISMSISVTVRCGSNQVCPL